MSDHDAEREKKRKKALRRMGKIVAKAWELPNAEPFHSAPKSTSILCLTSVGKKVDEEGYRHGRHGWEDFAKDIGGVYNRHVHRKTKHANLAKKHLNDVCSMLADKDQSLVEFAQKHVPEENFIEEPSKKRKSDPTSEELPRIKKKANAKTRKKTGDLTLGEREDKAMEALYEFIEQKGGSREIVENFRCRVNRKPSDGRYDTNYYNEQGRRFRSMVEVGKYFNLVSDTTRSAAGKKTAGIKKRKPTTTREIEAEKKKLRKELDKLRRQHTKATKALDDFLTEEKESRYPIDDILLLEEDEAMGSKRRKILPTNCAAANLPNIDSFAELPQYCMPDVLAAWDFLCTVSRTINVNPISFDDFLECLTYKAPAQLAQSDALKAPPVFLGEAHLGLLKLVLADTSSEDWWWSILETEETENAVADMGDAVGREESDLPLIKVDFAALLMENEDPLITTSWLQNLEQAKKLKSSDNDKLKQVIKTAMSVVANKWVYAYLRKALKLGKTSGSGYMKRAVTWLVDRVTEARPDLGSKPASKDSLQKARAKVVEEVSHEMEKLSSAALTVNDDDVASDVEDSEDESDESDDEGGNENGLHREEAKKEEANSDDRPASYIPPKPSPTLVDLLLPPGKPAPPNDLLSPACWPEMAGAAATRIIHRYKRLRNEVDDSLRLAKELPRLTVKERRQREALAEGRVFSEFATMCDGKYPAQQAADHLCAGGDYLDLTPLQRLCILRILIDAAYDTQELHIVIDNNIKQRKTAARGLENEQRKAKKEAREKAAADEAAARQDLALEAQKNFLEEKREEIRKANEANEALTNEEIDTLTEQDILDFDEDILADYEALPGPESFKKAEVLERVSKIQEAAAFETELLTVVTMDELHEREKAAVDAMEAELEELGGEEALMDPDLDRSTYRTIEKLRRELGKIKSSEDILPLQREAALENLKEAIAEGTIKSLRSAIKAAKTARLFGPDEATNGVWALDVVRDAHMELEHAKQLKKVADARKELISKINRSFIRTEPLGMDRFGNRFWHFENSDDCHVWAEVNYVLKEKNPDIINMPGFLPLVSDVESVKIGAADIEEDFSRDEDEPMEKFLSFSRQEYHQSGLTPTLAKRCWGGHVNESSVKTLMKGLDSRGIRENELKKNLKEAVDEKTSAVEGSGEKDVLQQSKIEGRSNEYDEEANNATKFVSSGDESMFQETKNLLQDSESVVIQFHLLESITSGIGQEVRKRIVVETHKDGDVARYEVGSVTGWKTKQETVPVEPEGDEFEPQMKTVEVPIWQAHTKQGHEMLLNGTELLESICRFKRWKTRDPTYIESDASFLAYRNSLGRHCGNKADAADCMTPAKFAQFMVRREAELYQRLKHCVYDNSWGGKAGSRNAWASSMKDVAYDFETVKDGFLTFENAYLELTGGFPEGSEEGVPSGKELLDNPATREDIELESIEKSVTCIWASKASRNVFLEIINGCKTIGFLALGLELVSRNTWAYLDANKARGNGHITSEVPYNDDNVIPMRTTRRMNAWQQKQEQDDDDLYNDQPVRRTRRRNAWQQAQDDGWD